jgi:HEPN domain-containing protein
MSLAQSYVLKSSKRLKALAVLLEEQDYSDVVREAQEIVELALKGILRQMGIEPPKQHDVGDLLRQYASRLPKDLQSMVDGVARDSKWLRKERELTFYGDTDFVPTEEYTLEDATRAQEAAARAVEMAQKVIPQP